MPQLNVGARMRDRETTEIVVVRQISGDLIAYDSPTVSGEVQRTQLEADFELLNDPSSREDIEAVLQSMYENGEISDCLVDTGLSHVAIRSGENGKPIFDWYAYTTEFHGLLAGN